MLDEHEALVRQMDEEALEDSSPPMKVSAEFYGAQQER